MSTNEITARVHSFESFGAVDGPGIRFIVFLQGCKLKCKFCHNRDTWDCNGGTIYTVEQILDKIDRYKNYIIPSGGGVTISGGEPFLQPDFLICILTELKKRGIHTAIDTSGNFQLTSKVKKIIELADLFLLDIKSINDEVCQELCGISNEKELEFATYLSTIDKPVWIRHVLVPTVTDNEADLLKMKEFLSTLTNVKKVEIIPYHDMGKFKWEALGKDYPLENIRVATVEDVNRARRIMDLPIS